MSAKNTIEEIKQLQLEIKRNNEINKNHRRHINELKESLAQYLESKGQAGLKYRGEAIVIEHRPRHLPKKKKEKENDVIKFLEELGVSDVNSAYQRLQNAQRGMPIDERKIKFKKLPNL